MEVPQYQNYIEVNIGGRVRKVKMAMEASKKITDWLLSDPQGIYNPTTRFVKSVMAGIDRKENDIPDGFDETMLMDWMDDMEQDDLDALDAFAMKALGFIMAKLDKKIETMYQEMEIKEVK